MSSSTNLQAQYVTLETESLRLVYQELPHSFIAEHAVRCFQNSYWFYENLFDFWADDQFHPVFYTREKVEEVTAQRIELRPGR